MLDARLFEPPININLMFGPRPAFDFDVVLNLDVFLALFSESSDIRPA
jgi:hypothetical protein